MIPIFPVYFFPPISWFAAIIRQKNIVFEQHSHFRKQGYSNRMRIQGANKIQPLTIPIRRTGEQTPILESEISYAENWQKDHWKGIESAYRSSPFFEYYESRIYPFFESREPFLIRHNLEILKVLFEFLEIETQWELSEKYLGAEEYSEDYRLAFDAAGNTHPEWFNAVPYPQVFRTFESDLSILDLLCNEGPGARGILMEGWSG